MKKIVISILIVLIAPFMTINAQSISNYTEEQLKQSGGLENLLENNQKDQFKESKMYESFTNNNKGIYNIDATLNNATIQNGGNKICILNICMLFTEEIVKQENNYYCGPASVKQTLNFIIGSSATSTQSYYASNMGTTSASGTYVYKIAEELDKHQSVNDYGWREIVNGNDKLWDPVYYDIGTIKVPLIARVDTSELEIYNGAQFTHYLTIHGFGTNISKTILYIDSYDGIDGVFGQQADTLNNFYMATSYLIW